MLEEKLLVFVLGAPGAGKGTQCDLVVKEYGWTHISAGDLLRAQVKTGTPVGKEAEEYLKQGTMVPASMIIGLLKEALSDAQHTKVLIDGFPRVLDQLKEFEKQVRPCDKALFYTVAEEAARERLLQRGKTSGRVDDNEETIRNRFVVFKQESMPVIEELQAEGRAVEIDAAQTPEQVFAATQQVIEELQQKQAQANAAIEQQPAQQQADSTEAAESAAEAAATPSAAAESNSGAASPVAAAEVAVPAAAAAVTAGAAAAAAGAAVAATAATAGDAAAADAVSPKPQLAVDVASPTAAQVAGVASPTAAGVTSPTAAGVMSPTASAAAAASPGSRTSLDVPPPAADAAAAASLPSPKGTLASLQVDLSGIRTPIVICGPSGVGKGTLINKLMADHPDRFGFSVSHTTRGLRPGEVHGQHYYFTSIEAMAPQVEAGLFLEHAMVHGNMYGTSLAAVAQVSAAGKHCVLDIDVQGAAQVRKSALGPQCLFIFVAPPSHEELERRLRNRGTETEEKVLQRLANADAEIAKAQEPGLFNHVLVNGELEAAYKELLKLVGQRVPGLVPPTDEQQQQQQQAAVSSPEATAVAAAGSSPKATAAALMSPRSAGAAATTPAGTPVAAVGSAAASPAAFASPRGATAAMAGAAGAAAGAGAAVGVAAMTAMQQPHHQLANGNVSTIGGTSTLLDFGFGSSAGPAVAAKGMPVRQYMDVTVIPVLREGLKALNSARPDDPLQFLADYLVAHKPAAA